MKKITLILILIISSLSCKDNLNSNLKTIDIKFSKAKIDLPEELIDAVESCKDNKAVRQVGIEFAIQQSKELLDAGVPVLHYYSMGKSDNIKSIASALF